ncbi:MAG: hypothetical protein LBT43_07465 [Prevotella sp.]|jgi:hypothetical protein|nr:hypothetical protein [Prevotella sp.]
MININDYDEEFRYMFLSRLQCDCNYHLGYGNRNNKHLWAGDEQKQIELMIELYNSFKPDKKPEWITMEKIHAYRGKICIPNK